jgi:putative ubiquitin-RnfH superfamily antitoxin RatB of RatAB toxin-antitoxin module
MAPAEAAAGPAPTIAVEVCYSPRAGVVERVPLTLPQGSTLAQALAASGLPQRHPEMASLECGVWGRKAPPETVLRERDRVEVWRALQVDPKEARRQRYKGQGKAQRRTP